MSKPLSPSLISGAFFLRILLIILISVSTFSGDVDAKNKKKGKPEPDVKIGERLYYGLIPMGEGAKACASCHTYYTADTINWNPSLLDMAQTAVEMDLATFKNHLTNPSGGIRDKVHVNYDMIDEQVFHLYGYLTGVADTGVPSQRMSINTILIFLLIGALMAAALLDLFITKKIPYKAVHILILLLGIGYQLSVVTEEAIDLGRSQDYRPDQPIKFSHKVHAGDNKIECLYCHSNADEGKSASIPGAGLCMNCHMMVRNGTNSGQFEIAKVVDHSENHKDIEWVRIHNLPDHVFFNHSQHVKVGGLDCTECHGQVEDMHILKQQKDLSMGWCLDCHKETNVKFEENDYYETFQDLHKDLEESVRDSIQAADIGANDCMKCHH
ncbi:MAG: cytochrome c3 family protein [Marinilabiliaceae bacterium]|nr:cytochrome c3 family protein [Marinilabiliaceae bacterium]